MAKKDKDQPTDDHQLAGGNPPPGTPETTPFFYESIENHHKGPSDKGPGGSSGGPTPADPAYKGIETGIYWGNSTVTYSFPDSSSDYGKGYPEANKFVPFKEGTYGGVVFHEQSAFAKVISLYAQYTLLNFVQNDSNSDSTADIRIGKTVTQGADAWSYYPGAATGGDTWYNINAANVTNGGKGGMDWANLQPGDYTYTVFMHEFGHSVGLKHSFENSGAGPVPKAYDSLEYTVMSYDAYQTSNPFDSTAYDSSVDQRNWWADNGNNPQTLMMLDIAALQHMYGADYLTNPGKTDYKWDSGTGALTITENDVSQTPIDLSPTNNIFMTVWDGGGTDDTYNFSGYTNPLVGISIDLRPGHWVTINDLALYNPDPNLDHSQRADLLAGTGEHFATGNIGNALIDPGNPTETASLIENAIGGTGNDILIGNDVGNKLTGGDGSDILTGGAGNDFFVFNSVIGIDTITDFHTAIDRLQFDNSGAFAAAGSDGGISGDAFYATAGGFADETPLDRFLYDTTNGNLYYDDDGSAADAPIQIALLNNHPALNYSDFQII